MKTLGNRQTNRRGLVVVVVFVSLLAAIFGIMSGAAQTPSKEGREVEDRIPKHLPIKVKVKKEKEEKVKDLNNDGWLGDLEIEVKNTGTKPIYFLEIILIFVDVRKDSGDELGYGLSYGRSELLDINNRPGPDDVPILPGETHVFKLDHDYVIGWDWYRNHVEKKPHPKKIAILFSDLNHGDGTGYATTGGLPIPNKKSSLDEKKKAGDTVAAARSGPSSSSGSTTKAADMIIPASFTPVNFYPPESGTTSRNKTASQTCSSGTQCEKMVRLPGGNCFCPNNAPADGGHIEVDVPGCSNPNANCSNQRYEFSECGSGVTYHTCIKVFLDTCGSTPLPPPPETNNPYADYPDCCIPVMLPTVFGLPGGWDLLCSCPQGTELPNGCYVKYNNINCVYGFEPTSFARQEMCCPQTASCGEGCQGDLPENGEGDTVGETSDGGQCPCASPVLIDLLGDGTGFMGTDGRAIPDTNERGASAPCSGGDSAGETASG